MAYDTSIPCTRCHVFTPVYEIAAGGQRWCPTCVATHATLSELLACLQARGLCFRQAKKPGEYVLDRDAKRFPHLLTALGRHLVELKALLRQGIHARYGPLLEWAPCPWCSECVHLDRDGKMLRHCSDVGTWCIEESAGREVKA